VHVQLGRCAPAGTAPPSALSLLRRRRRRLGASPVPVSAPLRRREPEPEPALGWVLPRHRGRRRTPRLPHPT
jgi:hypothetical protein